MGRIISHRTMVFLTFFSLFVILFILATLFTSLTEKELDITSTSPIDVGTPEFKTVVEGIVRSKALPIDSDIEIFSDGRKFLSDLLREIESAENSVTITNYIFKEGEMTNKTFDALIEKAEQGIEVRILLDAVGGHKAPEEKIEKLKKAGAKVEVFRPTNFRSLTRIYRRTHVRTIVIDGKIGYIGGMAFQDEWLGDGTREKEWRDLMFKFGGSLAKATPDQFNGLWRQTSGEILSGPDFYPDNSTQSATDIESYFVSLLHTPAPDVSADLLNLIWLTISGAKDHVYLASPYLTPPAEIIEALKKAVERGVRVELVVPGSNTDSKLVQSATRAYYERLLEAGVKIYEYQPGRFHSKFLTADGHWSLIGSANMDNRSATLNVENIFGIEDESLAQKLEEEFASNKNNSKEILREEWNPNIFKETYYKAVALFAKQF